MRNVISTCSCKARLLVSMYYSLLPSFLYLTFALFNLPSRWPRHSLLPQPLRSMMPFSAPTSKKFAITVDLTGEKRMMRSLGLTPLIVKALNALLRLLTKTVCISARSMVRLDVTSVMGGKNR